MVTILKGLSARILQSTYRMPVHPIPFLPVTCLTEHFLWTPSACLPFQVFDWVGCQSPLQSCHCTLLPRALWALEPGLTVSLHLPRCTFCKGRMKLNSPFWPTPGTYVRNGVSGISHWQLWTFPTNVMLSCTKAGRWKTCYCLLSKG